MLLKNGNKGNVDCGWMAVRSAKGFSSRYNRLLVEGAGSRERAVAVRLRLASVESDYGAQRVLSEGFSLPVCPLFWRTLN